METHGMAPHRRGGQWARRRGGRGLGAALLAAAAVAATLLVPAAPAQAIVGNGEKVTYPWAAVFVRPGSGPVSDRNYCSGVLLKPAWVLTAAHCTGGIVGDTVIIGRGDLHSRQGQVRTVSYVHRMWAYSEFCPSGSRSLCDVAVVRLRAMSTQPDLDLAGADVYSQWGPGSPARAYGYGLWSYDPRDRATHLARGHLRVNTLYQDHHWLRAFLDIDFGPSAICYGDSGGPLVVSTSKGPRVVGIAAGLGTFDCHPNTASFFIKTGWRGSVENSPVYRWITWRI